jgi:hypothetical protein
MQYLILASLLVFPCATQTVLAGDEGQAKVEGKRPVEIVRQRKSADEHQRDERRERSGSNERKERDQRERSEKHEGSEP